MDELKCYTENDVLVTLEAVENLCKESRKNGYSEVCSLCESNSFYCSQKLNSSCDSFQLSSEFRQRMLDSTLVYERYGLYE